MSERRTQINSRTRMAIVGLLSSLLLAGCATVPEPTPEELAQAAALAAEEAVRAGDAAVVRGDYQEALAQYLNAVSAGETAERWFKIGVVSSVLNMTERAMQSYLRTLELDPVHVEAHEALGLEYLELGQAETAKEHLTRAVSLDPARWRAHNGLGVLADRAQDYSTAIEHYEAALQANAESPMLMNNMGYSRYLAGDLDQAARDFYRATQISAEYSPAWANLGLIYARRAWYEDALTILSRVREAPVAYNDVGFIALRNGDLIEAEQFLSEAVRLSPTYYEAAHQNLQQARARLGRETSGVIETRLGLIP